MNNNISLNDSCRSTSPSFISRISVLVTVFFVALVGTNCANYYSTEFPYLGYLIIGAFSWFVFQCLFSQQARFSMKKCFCLDVGLWLLFLSLSVIFMIFSDRTFFRGDWSSHVAVLIVFCIGIYFGMNTYLYSGILYGVMIVVIASSLMNLFEFFIENNVWSTAPGRSAGFYVNPNISSANIVVYGILYFFRPQPIEGEIVIISVNLRR
jgi:hypothetical protein